MLQSKLAEDLISLASERSPEKRVELLRRVIDVYLDQAVEHSATEQSFFEDVITDAAYCSNEYGRKLSVICVRIPGLPGAMRDPVANLRDRVRASVGL